MQIPSNCRILLAEDDPGDANLARQAKVEVGGRAVFFERVMGETVRQRYQLERELRQAVAVRVETWLAQLHEGNGPA